VPLHLLRRRVAEASSRDYAVGVNRLAFSALLLAFLPAPTPAPAQDVHVRVEPHAAASSPGKPGGEAQTTFPTIQNALDHHPFAGPGGRVFIEIAPGTYHERIIVTQNHQNITFIGTGAKPEDTVITNSLNAKTAAVFDHSELNSNGPGFLTAQSRTDPKQPTGYVILNSRVTSSIDQTEAPMDPATPGAKSSASAKKMIGLGRPWRPYSRVVYINTELPADMNPLGWNNWGAPANESTAWYAEFGSTGPGAPSSASPRVPWAHALTPLQVKEFLPAIFLRGADNWNPIAAAAKLP